MKELLLQDVNYPIEIEKIVSQNIIDNNDMVKITAAIICKDEEKTIERCIKSIENKVDEIVIIDTGSIDSTIDVVNNMKIDKVKIYQISWNNSFASARNYALDKVTYKWVFFIDADEYLIDEQLDLHRILKLLDEYKSVNKTVFSPKIIDANGHCSIGVGRIFKKNSHLIYYGDVHEEVRIKKQDGYDIPENISLNITLMHDRYTDEIMSKKDKTNRNMNLIKKMLVKEHDNLRWIFFYLRDGENILDLNEIQRITEKSILIYPPKGFSKSNIVDNQYTYPILSIYISKMICSETDTKKIYSLIDILESINKENNDAIFYRTILKINEIRREEKQLLIKLIGYRKDNIKPQYGAMHSEGKNIDLLMGYFLFRLGYIEVAKKYFDYVNDFGDNNIFIMEYKNIVKSILSLYC